MYLRGPIEKTFKKVGPRGEMIPHNSQGYLGEEGADVGAHVI